MTEYRYDYEQFLENWNIWNVGFSTPVEINSKEVFVYSAAKKIEKIYGCPDCEMYIFEAMYRIGKKRRKERFGIIFSQSGVYDWSSSYITKVCADHVKKSIQADLYAYRFKPTMYEKWTDYDTGNKYIWWMATNREICDERYIL